MSNRWVISWLVIDYWRWSMSNRWVTEAQKFCGLSITHRWHRLLVDIIDYLLMLLITHRWPIDYSSTIILRTKDTFLVPFFSFVILLSVLDTFSLVSQRVSIARSYWPIWKTEQLWRGNHQGMVQQQTAKRYWITFWSFISM